MEKKRILCLDLDGTVRRTKSGKPFSENPDDVELIPGMKELIWKYSFEGWLIIYVTNQGGVAHGFKTIEDVEAEIQNTFKLLNDDREEYYPCFAYYVCLMEPKGKLEHLAWRSLSRKPSYGTPSYGMLITAEEEITEAGYLPDWDNSLFVGDRPEDEECAKSAGVPFMWAHDFVKQAEGYKTTQQSEGAGWESGPDLSGT